MSKLYDLFCAHPLISTDTRRIAQGSIFFALRGASFDGNRFAADALDKGAVAAVVDDPTVAVDDRYIVVEEVLTALQELAHEHRKALQIPILAIASGLYVVISQLFLSGIQATVMSICSIGITLLGLPVYMIAKKSRKS
jgi:hypothetical protein